MQAHNYAPSRMNLLLLDNAENDSRAVVTGERHQHIRKVLKLQQGDTLRVGIINGPVGIATVAEQSDTSTTLQLSINSPASPALPLTLILALPRPQMVKRILQTIATMGVHELHLIQTGKVEKSFWQSPAVTDQAIREQLILGLEQGVATHLPTVHKHMRFRPFAEDVLPSITPTNKKLIAHLGDYPSCPSLQPKEACTMVIGPEGGFTEREVANFVNNDYQPVQLGARVLKVETAVPVIISKLYY